MGTPAEDDPMSLSEDLLQFNSLAGGIEAASRQVTGQPSLAQHLLLQHLARFHPFSSVVDVGCGGGSWLRAALDLGAARAAGYDLVPVPDEALAVDRGLITITDLSRPIEGAGRYDLAVSTEVAEHIPEACADVFVDNLCRFSDIVLFSAALPYQGGIHHKNENWVEYWNRKFRHRDYVCFDIFREVFWNDTRIPYFYRQNCLLFVRTKWSKAMEARGLTPSVEPRSLVHPELLIQAVNRALPTADRQFLRDAAMLYQVAIEGRAPADELKHTYGEERLWS
jgi:Methyltransferase domain